MLSYRHAFHAGNHADVLKHLCLIAALDYLVQKEKPLVYVDTHAGAGKYLFDNRMMQKGREFERGVDLVKVGSASHPMLKRLIQLTHGEAGCYAGSPLIAARCLRPYDQLYLFEKHSEDFKWLEDNLAGDKRTTIEKQDGFAGLKALLPPATRRGLVLIDPSYELAEDYKAVLVGLRESLKRFATGVYMVWFPLLNKTEISRFRNSLQKLPAEKWLLAQLQVKQQPDGVGMYGSAMFVVNPPWQLTQVLGETLPLLAKILGQDKHAKFELEKQGI